MRDKIAKKLERILKKRFDETNSLFCADWDGDRISHEDSIMSELYHESPDTYQSILDEACRNTEYFLENINSCELHVCKC